MEHTRSYVRVHGSWLASRERILLVSIAKSLPAWVRPDHLTLLGVVGSALCGLGFAASGFSPTWLWLACTGLFINWFGDSLDGNLARVRNAERPKYGFFVDHTSDIVSQVFIFLGLGLSSSVRFETGCLLLMSYWLAAIFTFIRTISAHVFQISYFGVGPTEIRLGLIAYAVSLGTVGPLYIHTRFGPLSAMDVLAVVIFSAVMIMFTVMTMLEARKLNAAEAQDEPVQRSAPTRPAYFGITMSDKAGA